MSPFFPPMPMPGAFPSSQGSLTPALGIFPLPRLSLGLNQLRLSSPSIPKSDLFPIYGCASWGEERRPCGFNPTFVLLLAEGQTWLPHIGNEPGTLPGVSPECGINSSGTGFHWDQLWLELAVTVP